MKRVLVIAACALLVFAVYLSYTTVDTETPTAVAKHKETVVYTGTVYVAGMGGHFAAAKVSIDPADSANPIKVVGLDRVVIGDKKTHPTHDARIDPNDRSKMYWSTYKIDESAGPRASHVGLSDLKSGKKLIDKVVEVDKKAAWTGALYCGSGQTAKSFLPVTMTGEAYIDVFNKKDLKLNHRVFLDDLGYKNNYLFFHGTNSPDMKNFAVSINKTDTWPDASTPGKLKGEIEMVVLDLASLEKGKVKVVAKNKVTGAPGKTITFRQTYTPDGKYLLQSGADRFYVLNGKDMSLYDEEILDAGENHDAISTPDGKYAILTLRSKVANPLEQGEQAQVTDGTIQLYDIQEKQVIGKPASVCLDCHTKIGLGGNAVLCGADVNWD